MILRDLMQAADRVTFLRRPGVCLAETAVLSKSSTLTRVIERLRIKFPITDMIGSGIVCFLVQNKGGGCYQLPAPRRFTLSFSGSNQAREGRLADALAVRGDERRDTLR